jgi:hypothetical protein
MLTATFRRTLVLLLLAAVLAAPWASAAGLRSESSRPAKAVESISWDLLDGVWSFLRSVWETEGCHIDPSGTCDSGTPTPPQTKGGCHIDPDGVCRP